MENWKREMCWFWGKAEVEHCFSPVCSSEGRSSISQLFKTGMIMKDEYFSVCVSETNLSWDKISHSVDFIMFNFVLGKEQTVSVLYNHTLRLPTQRQVLIF